jgi:hypothetical protein
MSTVAAAISPPVFIAPAATSVLTAIASDSGLATPVGSCAFSAWGRLRGLLRFEAVLALPVLRDAAVFETLFLETAAVFAAVRRPALAPPRDLDAVVFAGLLLRDEVALFETLFLEAAVFFAEVRFRALLPPRDLEAVVFGDLAIYNSFQAGPTCTPACPALLMPRRHIICVIGKPPTDNQATRHETLPTASFLSFRYDSAILIKDQRS